MERAEVVGGLPRFVVRLRNTGAELFGMVVGVSLVLFLLAQLGFGTPARRYFARELVGQR